MLVGFGQKEIVLTYCYCIRVVVVLNVVDVFNQAIPCRFDFVELSGNHVEPCVGFGDFFEAQGDHAAHVALCADVVKLNVQCDLGCKMGGVFMQVRSAISLAGPHTPQLFIF